MTDPTAPANVRLRLSQRDDLDALAEAGVFDSRTAAVQQAVDELLDEHEDELDTEA